MTHRHRDDEKCCHRRRRRVEDEDPVEPDRPGNDRSHRRPDHECCPRRSFDRSVDPRQPLGIVGQERAECRYRGEHRSADEAEDESGDNQAGQGLDKDHSDSRRDEEDLAHDEDSPRVEAVYENPGDRRADERGDSQCGHHCRHPTGGGFQLEGCLTPDPDEEGRFTPDPRDEAGENYPANVSICPHAGHGNPA
ncbi:MAG TPA: hypothetical protein VMS99_11345 [Acidimicrobiia bacterium]|nr:hypothetical protein [Acidimicrobiia bacterium]